MNAAGAIIANQVFAYDAFGNRLDGNAALTTLLYSGEQTDPTGLQYLRARYYNPANGRFNRLDPFEGSELYPLSLQKYIYTENDPVHGTDPSGLFRSLFGDTAFGIEAEKVIRRIYISDFPGEDTLRSGRATKIGKRPPKGTFGSLYYAKPDLLNKTRKRYGEIKPLSISGIAAGAAQLLLRVGQFRGTNYKLHKEWVPSTHFARVYGQRIVFVNVDGLVLYSNLTDLAEDVVAIGSIALAREFAAKYTLQSAFTTIRALAGARTAVDGVRFDSHLSIGFVLAGFGVV